MNSLEPLFVGAFFSILVAILSYRLQLLTQSGAVMAFCLGTVVLGLGGWPWAVPILTFFLSSSLLSRLGQHRKQRVNLIYQKSSQRDAVQVLANAGCAGAAVVVFALTHSEIVYTFFLGSIAAVNADTWATEIGSISSRRPRLITRWIPVEAGTSGAISLLGTLGALGGGLLIAVAGHVFHPFPEPTTGSAKLVTVVSITGLLGSLIDSLLGATIQVQYRCPACGAVTERKHHCSGVACERSRGTNLIDNDGVNAITSLAGGGLALLLTH